MSRTSVGRPVSLPSALAKLLLPLPGTPRRRTPRGLTFLLGCSARLQKLFRLDSPPKDANDSLPRCSRLLPITQSGDHRRQLALAEGNPHRSLRPQGLITGVLIVTKWLMLKMTLSASASFRDGKAARAIMPRKESEFREGFSERRCRRAGVNKKW